MSNDSDKKSVTPAMAADASRASQSESPRALTINERKIAELQSRMDETVETSGFLPLMGAFQDYVEAERTRNARLIATLVALFTIILALFLIGPIYMGRAFLIRAETAFSAERQSFQQFQGGVQSSLSDLAKATAELRKTIEMRQAALPPVAALPVPTATNVTLSSATTAAIAQTNSIQEVSQTPPPNQDKIMQIVGEIEATIAAIDQQGKGSPQAAAQKDAPTVEPATKKTVPVD